MKRRNGMRYRNIGLFGGLLIRDSFTDSNGTSLASHTPDIGGAWTVDTGTATVENNAAQLAAGTPDIATIDSGLADHTMQCIVNHGNRNRMGWIIRFASTSSFVFFEASGDANAEAQLRYYDGAYNTVASATFTWANPQTVRITAAGTTIDCCVDDVLIVSGTVTEASAATAVGLWGWAWGTATTDNLEVR